MRKSLLQPFRKALEGHNGAVTNIPRAPRFLGTTRCALLADFEDMLRKMTGAPGKGGNTTNWKDPPC